MQDHFLAFVGLLGLAIVGVFFLWPDTPTRLEVDLVQSAPEDALQRLDAPGAYDLEQGHVTLTHIELLRAAGRFEQAKELLETLLEDNPENSQVGRSLYDIVQLQGDYETATALVPETEAEREARADARGAMYRILRDKPSEIDTLRSIKSRPLTEWEVDRLVRLLFATKQTRKAELLLLQYAEAGVPFSPEAKEKYLILLINSGQSDDAARQALEWAGQSDPDTTEAEDLLSVFFHQNATEVIPWLVNQYKDKWPELEHTVISLLAQNGQPGEALRLQQNMLAKGIALSEQDWNALIEFAGLTGNVTVLQRALPLAMQGQATTAQLSEALLQVLRYSGPKALVPYRAQLVQKLEHLSPLIAAALTIEQGLFPATVEHLSEAANSDLSDWEEVVWTTIAYRLQGTGYDRQLVLRVQDHPTLREDMRRIAQGLYP